MAEQRSCGCTYTTMDAPDSCFMRDVNKLGNLQINAFSALMSDVNLDGNCFKMDENVYLESVFIEYASSFSTAQLLFILCNLKTNDKRYNALIAELRWRNIEVLRVSCVLPDGDPYMHQLFLHNCKPDFRGIGFCRLSPHQPDGDNILAAIRQAYLQCGTASTMMPATSSGQLEAPSHRGFCCGEFRPKMEDDVPPGDPYYKLRELSPPAKKP